MARYLVGPYNNSWNFMDALEKAQDGDTIEFENGYVFQWPTDEVIVINKSLHFVGHVVPNPNGNGRMFNNTIEASFRFVEGAQVTFEDLWFKVGGNYTALTLWNESAITCKQVYFEITTPTNSEFYLYGYAFENDIGWSWDEGSGKTPKCHRNVSIRTVHSKFNDFF